ARDLRYDRRLVALKVLKRFHDREAFDALRGRLEREAMGLTRLSHPNIVTAHEYGFDEGEDLFFLVLEFVDGVSLYEHLRARPEGVPWREAMRIGLPLAMAVEHAHERGVL